ncbi:MAG: hypothetical protein A2X79_01230 [Desulfuromonadaceae bacterium GWB2_53_15]|nr:MAG: hypothetical protein A2X83_11110 [Desulfuromonadales bacterium GWD2_54_10]OHB25799.1 MAG: hypothetical protein A2X79_01230 [Desulfuromonadaceae bacterium GWB2_53_15]
MLENIAFTCRVLSVISPIGNGEPTHVLPEMIKKSSDHYLLAALSLGAILTILASIRFLDEKIAIGVMHLLKSNHVLHSATSKIPDTLLGLVCIATAVMWLAYIIRSRYKGSAAQLRFLQLAATAVPVAYLLKEFLQLGFGRTNTRLWLASGGPLQFNWFNGAGIGCFPSGHMTVFAAFGVAIWYIYPRYGRTTSLGLVLLGTALIATDYHFLSDVIAGAYVGFLVTYGIRYFLQRCGAKLWALQ